MPKIVRNYRLFIFLLALSALLMSNQTWLRSIDESLFSTLVRTLPGKLLGQDVVIVTIDKTSQAKYGHWPWSADTVAKLIRQLDVSGAAAQVYLPPLVYPDVTSTSDLTMAISQVKTVYLNSPYHPSEESRPSLGGATVTPLQVVNPHATHFLAQLKQWLLGQTFATEQMTASPSPELSSVAKGQGVSQISAVKTASIAEAMLIADESKVLPALSLVLAADVLDTRFADIRLSPQYSIKLGKNVLRLDANYRFLPYPIRKTDSKNKIRAFSAAAVLENKVRRSRLRNKIVIIGLADEVNQKHNVAPGSHVDNPLWTAFVLQSMLSELTIWRPYWASAFQKALIILIMLYFMFLPTRYQGRIGLGIGVVLFVVLLNIELLGLLVNHAWLPLFFPAMFLLFAHVLIAFRNQVWIFITKLQNEVSDSYRTLASNLLSQGKLDEAFDKYQRCETTEDLLQDLYLLGIEYERRRQFSKALIVYEHITQFDPNYRDIKERRERHFSNSDKFSLISTLSGNFGETLVVDDPNIAQPVLGRYEIIESIGKGAMGTVFLGKDPKIGRTVAIKTLPLSKEFDTQQLDSVRSRFYREAETAGRLSHPNIVTIYDVGEEHDLAYIAMDFIDGSSLEHFVRPGYLLTVAEVFIIGITVADALDYAHKQKVVHRDIKPANVMYNGDKRVVKVTDFGIACLTDKSKTMTGTVLGSPSYMSPEQLEGKKLSGSSDIFSLGVTLYQLFSGSLPFNAETMASLAYKIANEKPKSIRKVRGDLPSCLTRVINKCLEKDPRHRYKSGGELADALRKCAS